MDCADECLGPPNFKELSDTTGFGLNVNGSVCLNNICMCVNPLGLSASLLLHLRYRWANVTVGLACVVQNTAYTAYGPDGEFVDIVSRYVTPIIPVILVRYLPNGGTRCSSRVREVRWSVVPFLK